MARTRAPLRRRPRLTPRHSASGRPHGELLLASPSSRLFQVTKIALRHFSYQGGRAFVAGTGTPTRLVLTLRLSGRGTTRVEDSTTRRMRQSRRRPRTAPRRLQAHPPAHTPLLSASGRRPTTGTPDTPGSYPASKWSWYGSPTPDSRWAWYTTTASTDGSTAVAGASTGTHTTALGQWETSYNWYPRHAWFLPCV